MIRSRHEARQGLIAPVWGEEPDGMGATLSRDQGDIRTGGFDRLDWGDGDRVHAVTFHSMCNFSQFVQVS
ncbi:hypothetical protein [Woodsholea maritima]|uniref:hypothetical protein n=1 Tax=Woodsholea maritima TaxID=240237 RepID=UPI000364C9EF|nr:hypothetical protein [Woodsholea maritima]